MKPCKKCNVWLFFSYEEGCNILMATQLASSPWKAVWFHDDETTFDIEPREWRGKCYWIENLEQFSRYCLHSSSQSPIEFAQTHPNTRKRVESTKSTDIERCQMYDAASLTSAVDRDEVQCTLANSRPDGYFLRTKEAQTTTGLLLFFYFEPFSTLTNFSVKKDLGISFKCSMCCEVQNTNGCNWK